jgi:allantoicase
MTSTGPREELPGFTQLIDLAAERLGGAVLVANDEFFAEKENLIKAAAPVWIEGRYNDRGKWMDGWETRRRRSPGHDWCVIRLGLPGIVRGVVVDTSFFTGNYPEAFALEGCRVAGTPDPEEIVRTATWIDLLPRTPLRGDARQAFAVAVTERVTHLRFTIHPDGGVARLRVFGDVVPDPKRLAAAEVDLASAELGGLVVACSDQHYGHPNNLLMPGRATSMADGWETRRRRGPGNDWAIVRLAAPGRIARIEVDTDFYRGNAPGSCRLEGTLAPGAPGDALAGDDPRWTELLPLTPLQPHTRHVFEPVAASSGNGVSHVRFSIYPDGGVARLRLFGAAVRVRVVKVPANDAE